MPDENHARAGESRAFSRREWCLFLSAMAAGSQVNAGVRLSTNLVFDDRPMASFWKYFDATSSLALEARGAVLVDKFFEPHRDLYAKAGITWDGQRVTRWLAKFIPMAPKARGVHNQLIGALADASRLLTATIPDFDGKASPVSVLPSLFSFDAHLEADGNNYPLYLGVDGIARQHDISADLSILLTHELFHCYQGQIQPDIALLAEPPVYVSTWTEGTATYVSERLHQGAALNDILFDRGPLAAISPPQLRHAALALTRSLDSTSDSDQQRFFQMGGGGTDFPPRVGYYLGLLIARQHGERGMDFREMAALAAPRIRPLVAQGLQRIIDSQG